MEEINRPAFCKVCTRPTSIIITPIDGSMQAARQFASYWKMKKKDHNSRNKLMIPIGFHINYNYKLLLQIFGNDLFVYLDLVFQAFLYFLCRVSYLLLPPIFMTLSYMLPEGSKNPIFFSHMKILTYSD